MLQKLMGLGTFAVLMLVAMAARPDDQPQTEVEGFGGGFGGGFGIGAEGFGGGGFGGGGFGGQRIMIEPSQSGKSLNAYSEAIGEWDKLAAEPHPEHGLTPILSTTVAAVGGKTQVHAFSTEFGKWATLDVGEEVDVNQIVVYSTHVVYRANTHIHAFSNASGKWASVDLTKD